MYIRAFTIFILMVLMTIVVGCSDGDKCVTPYENPNSNDLLPVIGVSESGTMFNAIGILGHYTLRLSDIDKTAAELVPARESAIGESYIVNGKSFFTITPCHSCLKIKSIALSTDNTIQVKFYIRHPFQKGDPIKPPSGKNRLDLDVFDAALLIRPLNVAPSNFSLTKASAYTGFIANASGYTRELQYVIDDQAALPFVLVVDDNKLGTKTYNRFDMGAEADFDVQFDVSDTVTFELFLTMGYGASATKAMRLNPRYYNPEFNRKSAWKVIVTPPNGNVPPDITNTWNEIDNTTPFNVTVKVFDWQIGADVNPELVDPDDIYAASGVSSVTVEIPGMNSTLPQLSNPNSGTGMPNDPLIYVFSIANENLLAAGKYTGLVKVSDERVPGRVHIGGETDTLAHSVNGVALQWKEIPEFATYQTFTATVMGIPPLVVDVPNGGEHWAATTEQKIKWHGADIVDFVKIEYSKDNFVSDIHEITPSTENDGEFLWVIPNDESNTVKIRVTAVGYPGISDQSDNYFSITRGLLEMIVYAADGPAPGRQIYSIDPLGIGPPHQWTNSSALFNEGPKLSPCGGYIIYTAADFGFAELRIINVQTKEEMNINPPGLQTVYGDFSNDGTKIVGACANPWYAPKDLYTFDYTGGNVQRLTNGADAWAPSYNYNDTKIYYQGFSSMHIYIYDVATGQITQYTNNGVWNDDPQGDPAGQYITWATSYGNSCRWVYVSPVSSWTPPTYLINFDACVRSPCFSPDGTRIIVDHGGYQGSELAIYTLATGQWQNITSNSWGDYMADWGYIQPFD